MTNTKIRELVNANSFLEYLTAELYTLIDEEIEKGDEMDCELVDELVNAIEALENAEEEKKTALILPLIFNDGSALAKRIKNKVNGRNTFMRLTAIAAAVALLLSGTNQLLLSTEGTTLVQELTALIDKISDVFTHNKIIDETTTEPDITEPSNTEEPSSEPTTENTEAEEEKAPSPAVSVEYQKLELVTSEEFKTSYLWQEKLDLTGLQIFAVYTDGSKTEIEHKDCEFSGFNSLKTGEQTVTVEYKGKTATFNVTVSRTDKNDTTTRTITNVECSAGNDLIIFTIGTDISSVQSAFKWRYVYSDGTFSEWEKATDCTLVSDYNETYINAEQSLLFATPNGMTFTVKVILYDNTVESGKEVKSLKVYTVSDDLRQYPTRFEYFVYVGEECDFSKTTIMVTYSDGTSEKLIVGESDIQFFGDTQTNRPSPYKGNTVTFVYGNKKVAFTYDVLVKPELRAYEFNEDFWQVYYVGDAPAEIDTSKLVKGIMTTNSEAVWLDVEVKGYDPSQTGYIYLDVYFEGEYLGNVMCGFIYGDTGYAVLDAPQKTIYYQYNQGNFWPINLFVAKCIGNGELETINMVPDYDTLTPQEEFKMGYEGFANYGERHSYPDQYDGTVEYNMASSISGDPIDQIAEFKIYEVEPVYNDNGKLMTYEQTKVVQDLSYEIKFEQKPYMYEVEAPSNIKINIRDIQSEFYDKIKVYALYRDGTSEQIDNYFVYMDKNNFESSSAKLTFDIYVSSIFAKDPKLGTYVGSRALYVYSEGYEDSFYITVEDNRYKEYENIYLADAKKPYLDIYFNTATTKEKCANTNSSSYDNLWSVDGWDTSTPGEYEATITYHSPIGDFKTTYKYIVWDEYLEPKTELILDDSITHYDYTVGFEKNSIKILHTNRTGKTEEIENYSIRYYPTYVDISYRYPEYQELFQKQFDISEMMPTVGTCENITVEVLNNNDIHITADSPYPPANGKAYYFITIFDETGKQVCKFNSTTPDFTVSAQYGLANKEHIYLQMYTNVVIEGDTWAKTTYESEKLKIKIK